MKALLQMLTGQVLKQTTRPTGPRRTTTSDSPMVVLDEHGRHRTAALKDGTRVYVIGDIHGQIECLQHALARIVADKNASEKDRVN